MSNTTKNQFIIGTPGSGISKIVKRNIINDTINNDNKIIIIDPYGEFTEMVNKLNGLIIKINKNMNTDNIITKIKELYSMNIDIKDRLISYDLSEVNIQDKSAAMTFVLYVINKYQLQKYKEFNTDIYIDDTWELMNIKEGINYYNEVYYRSDNIHIISILNSHEEDFYDYMKNAEKITVLNLSSFSKEEFLNKLDFKTEKERYYFYPQTKEILNVEKFDDIKRGSLLYYLLSKRIVD